MNPGLFNMHESIWHNDPLKFNSTSPANDSAEPMQDSISSNSQDASFLWSKTLIFLARSDALTLSDADLDLPVLRGPGSDHKNLGSGEVAGHIL